MRRGDFSALPIQLFDPATCTVSRNRRVCSPFAGNQIPLKRIHPTSLELLEFYPEPNAGGALDAATGVIPNNYVSQQNRIIVKGFPESSSSTAFIRGLAKTAHIGG